MAGLERAGLAELRAELITPLRGDVCEVGAGTGFNLAHYRSVSSLVLVEPDPAMAKRLRRRLVRMSSSPLADIAVDTLEGRAFPDASFDAVVCTLVLCSAARPRELLSEMRHVLRPAGALVLIEHVRDRRPMAAVTQDMLTPLQRLVAGGCHLNRRTLDTVQAAGFDTSGIREVSLFSKLSWFSAGIAGTATLAGVSS